jgi:isoaspartyl peptidase/L-asparaginase-like protein (Ntn-hydrolase superfamily)
VGVLAMRLPPEQPPPQPPAQPRLFALPGGAGETEPEPSAPAAARTLDDVLTAAWAAVSEGHEAVCPVCAGAMVPRWSAGAGAVGGRCADCGATLD